MTRARGSLTREVTTGSDAACHHWTDSAGNHGHREHVETLLDHADILVIKSSDEDAQDLGLGGRI